MMQSVIGKVWAYQTCPYDFISLPEVRREFVSYESVSSVYQFNWSHEFVSLSETFTWSVASVASRVPVNGHATHS